MTDVRMHRDAVDAFCAGRLDRAAEAALARQVARVYTCEPILPNHTVSQVGRLSRHLGGQDEVLRWMGQFEGEPRFVAAMIEVTDLLGALSGNAQVLDALRSVRTRPEFRRFATAWAPTTDHVTLSDLGETVKHLLRQDRYEAASGFATDVVRLLDETLRLVDERGGDARLARDYLGSLAEKLERGAAEMREEPAGDGAAEPVAVPQRRPLFGRSRRRVAVG